ncbi:anthranilate synthase component II [Aequorivita marina]|uniref:anthranilate synthase component II n=1 Tax=Aequorivita marina TaxID=3073654 RepID=UPI002875C9F7|nr:aminodeoxychorismate/anthranilate synthase component II [Aequorivita sp. S2608]MDS1298392.1 aminodeoxychorismate/anthranilate synthase component II [Aequorivita sp. S2608]
MGLKILVIDNYDSFVYNLVHYLEELDCEVSVKRNDRFTLEEVADFDKILLSPGPGIPDEAGLLKEVIKQYATSKPILGVCLGQQAIGEVFGGNLENLSEVFHGVATTATILSKNEPLFKGLESKIEIGRYHSWVVSKKGFPEVLEVTSEDDHGQIMSLRHKFYNVCGVQFHPESVLTPMGKQIIRNWVTS